MSAREPWLGVASAAGLVLMLLGEGAVDVMGFLIAMAPLAYGFSSSLVRLRDPRGLHDRNARRF